MKTYLKTFPRMFRKHFSRLVSVVLMVLVSVGFCAGIGMATDEIDAAIDGVYRSAELSDFIVKSTRETGFTDRERSLLEERYGEDGVLFGASLEFESGAMHADSEVEYPIVGKLSVATEMAFRGVGEGVTKVYFFDGAPEDLAQNRISFLEREDLPGEEDVIGVYAERETAQLLGYAPGTELGATVTNTVQLPALFGGERVETQTYRFRVCGTVENPLHMAVRKDISLQFEDEDGDQKLLESVFYLFGDGLVGSDRAPAANDAYLRLPDRSKTAMGTAYETAVEAEREALETLLSDETYAAEHGGDAPVAVLTLFDNFSFGSFHEYGDSIEGIGYVMTVVFLLVTLLVVLSTMTRLLDEERAQIACLLTLGYSPARILVKYLLFALVGTVLGGAGGYFASLGLSYLVYINFRWNFTLPPYPAHVTLIFYVIVAAVILLATVAATLVAGLRMTRTRPATLLRPKAPKAGRKVLIERIPLIWNRLPFRSKSTLRNVFRFKTRFFMTVVAVMASTALVLAGLAVLDCCIFGEIGTGAMIGVAVLVLVFAALLNAVVIYTLTNINISERNRELATLMVLGYYDGEVAGYVYREIYVTSAVGIALGVPFGCLLCYYLFQVMNFGSVAAMGWYTWIVAPLLSLLFTFAVTLLLRHRIVRIDMNESLKAVE